MKSKTIRRFCADNEYSLSFYYKQKKLGLTPVETEWGRTKRITNAAEEEWAKKRQPRAKPAEAAKSPEAE
jgi:hypothetical protein